MPKYILLLSAALFMMFAACSEDRGRPLSDYTDADINDSLIYYYVQLRAHDFWQRAASDTALRSEEARAKFLEGVEKGLKSVKEDDDFYNYGVEVGTRMAINLQKFEKMYDVHLDQGIALESLRYGLFDGSGTSSLSNQSHFFAILDKMKATQRSKDHEKAKMSLIEEAREQNMTKLADNLYYKILRKGSGPYFSIGNSAYVVVNYERGDSVDFALPSPGLVTLGAEGLPPVLQLAYSRLNKGTVAKFATTAESLFGSRTYMMGLKPETVMLFTITLNEIVSPHTTDSVPATEYRYETRR